MSDLIPIICCALAAACIITLSILGHQDRSEHEQFVEYCQQGRALYIEDMEYRCHEAVPSP